MTIGKTTPFGRGFHEKAATVNKYFLAVSPTKVTADQREAPRRPSVFLSKKGFFALADSPCFHAHSLLEHWLRCQLESFFLETGAALSVPN